MKKIENKQNINIVGFSYAITDINSKKTWLITKELGQQTSQKIEIAHGYDWNNNQKVYGHSFIHLGEKGPFYSIVGGYTDYTSNDFKSPNAKDDEWGIDSKDKFCIREGYAWNRFLNQEGYSRTYIYLLENNEICNLIGGKIQSTANDSRFPWLKSSSFGKQEGKEVAWTGSYGSSLQYGSGYNWFTFYLDEKIFKIDIDPFLEKAREIQQQKSQIQLQQPVRHKKNLLIEKKESSIDQQKALFEYSKSLYSAIIKAMPHKSHS